MIVIGILIFIAVFFFLLAGVGFVIAAINNEEGFAAFCAFVGVLMVAAVMALTGLGFIIA